MTNQKQPQHSFSDQVLSWYDIHARTLPWRSKPGVRPTPYHVWLSEIMLQQTTVATVGPYFEKFLQAWPTVGHMAAAPLDDILTAWAGLGYYARARNLHKCAISVQRDFAGIFPQTRDELLSLPGIGPYTAAAISSIAFDQPEAVVDGNIERILARIYRITEPLPGAKKTITKRAEELTPSTRAGDYAQALMDIGATICTPRNPKCEACPISGSCAANEKLDMETFPVKAPKKIKPTRRAFILWLETDDGSVLLRRRDEKGLLGGMMEFPSTSWQAEEVTTEEALARFSDHLSADASFLEKDMVRHTFTHFHLHLRPLQLPVSKEMFADMPNIIWVKPENFSNYALPTLMTKVVKSVQQGQGNLL
ncbi:A/G-specific adenine glycosylase [Sneathiella marina]|uniref:Adenine DNA glycosylase n=1 Tax=Sneathiella marina TaxID=2950108 RepID=A0ABY4W8D9_9PROT|nr:A/G-specific adenine glycosylase [Sneathiella marina]USG62192.1 A/G-specific adenine glycosylase [Sneathiella marina]